MVGMPVSVKGHFHVCADIAKPPPRPHIGGPICTPKQKFVKISGKAIACKGDKAVCIGTPAKKAKIKKGSKICRIKGKKIARMMDSCTHLGGKVMQGTMWLTSE